MKTRIQLCEELREALDAFQAMSNDHRSPPAEVEAQRQVVYQLVHDLVSIEEKVA